MTGNVAAASMLKTGINGTPRLSPSHLVDRIFEKVSTSRTAWMSSNRRAERSRIAVRNAGLVILVSAEADGDIDILGTT